MNGTSSYFDGFKLQILLGPVFLEMFPRYHL